MKWWRTPNLTALLDVAASSRPARSNSCTRARAAGGPTASLKDADACAELAVLNADVMVVVAYGLLLPQAVLDTPCLGCINVHASLPRWRGAAPI